MESYYVSLYSLVKMPLTDVAETRKSIPFKMSVNLQSVGEIWVLNSESSSRADTMFIVAKRCEIGSRPILLFLL